MAWLVQGTGDGVGPARVLPNPRTQPVPGRRGHGALRGGDLPGGEGARPGLPVRGHRGPASTGEPDHPGRQHGGRGESLSLAGEPQPGSRPGDPSDDVTGGGGPGRRGGAQCDLRPHSGRTVDGSGHPDPGLRIVRRRVHVGAPQCHGAGPGLAQCPAGQSETSRLHHLATTHGGHATPGGAQRPDPGRDRRGGRHPVGRTAADRPDRQSPGGPKAPKARRRPETDLPGPGQG